MNLEITSPRKQTTISVGYVLLCVVALEASLLGSGRLIEIGSLSLKMYLYAIAQAYMLYRIVRGAKLRVVSVFLVGTFSILLAFATIAGLAQDAPMDLISVDVNMSLYIVMLLFCETTICDMDRVKTVCNIFKFSAVFLSVTYLIIFLLIVFGVINFVLFYQFMARTDSDVLFRGTTGLMEYKGTIYIALGSFLLMFQKGKWSKALSIYTLLAVVATFTRGFLVAYLAAGVVQLFTGRQPIRTRLLALVGSIAIVGAFFVIPSPLNENRVGSNRTRVDTLEQIADAVTPVSFFFGHGLGEGVPIRPSHMEIAYSEIFHKQGVLGLTWWLLAFGLVIWRYRAAARTHYEIAQPLLLAVVFDFCLSATNPYVNTPVGMFVLFAALAILAVLAEQPAESSQADKVLLLNMPQLS